jgi:NADH dehydrogenase (ubiquinone) 1 beta subcomplex subunit 2
LNLGSAGHHSEGVTYEGLTLPKPSKWHVGIGKGMAGLMWFWIFYRFYHDKDHFLYGPAAHFEHELAHENDHVGEDSHH